MQTTFANQLDALAAWRRGLDGRVVDLVRHLKENDLDEDRVSVRTLEALCRRLQSDRLNVAFVAEFSRGKSELINAIFFADTGRRMLPATPGRTTMCPVEIGFEVDTPPQMMLLPIETRLDPMPLTQWREHPDRWTILKLDPQSPTKLSESLAEVMRTKAVTIDTARALGLWHDDRPDDNPATVAAGMVEVPAWRHTVINYPHPLLRRGLVVLDTPGLNAIGTEPELTLSLLPSANAVVFILAADTGVTKSDLAVWREHLGGPAMTRIVALNKIDTLVDPLLSGRAIEMQIESQRHSTANLLGVEPAMVFPVSARQALTARVEGRADLLKSSRVPLLELALSAELLPRRHELLSRAAVDIARDIERRTTHRLGDARRQVAEQLVEMRSLRGKNSGKTALIIKRVEQEAKDFERSASRVGAIHAIHVRMLRSQLQMLMPDQLRDEIKLMQRDMQGTVLNLGAKKAFAGFFDRLRERLRKVRAQGAEAHEMLEATFKQLNAEHGFALSLANAPVLEGCQDQLNRLEASYAHYLGFGNALKLSDARFMDQFLRMLLSKVRVAFDEAGSEIEAWHKAASHQLDSQLRDRRQAFQRRQESLERIVGAHDELESRIAEVEAQDKRLQSLHQQTQSSIDALRRDAESRPAEMVEARAKPLVKVDAGAHGADDAAVDEASADDRDDHTKPMELDGRPHFAPVGGFVQHDSSDGAFRVDTALEPAEAAAS
jgi:vacuolar-type H+-ATPase subunit E/Vma4